jgi:hypothetical protein
MCQRCLDSAGQAWPQESSRPRRGPIMAASTSFDIVVTGVAVTPHRTTNDIDLSSLLLPTCLCPASDRLSKQSSLWTLVRFDLARRYH